LIHPATLAKIIKESSQHVHTEEHRGLNPPTNPGAASFLCHSAARIVPFIVTTVSKGGGYQSKIRDIKVDSLAFLSKNKKKVNFCLGCDSATAASKGDGIAQKIRNKNAQ